MVLVLVLSLTACAADPNCGTYVLKTLTVDDIKAEAGTGEDKIIDAKIELKKAGACDVVLDGATYAGSWKSDNNSITISLQETDSVGTISGNTLSIDLFGIGMMMEYEKK